MGGYTISVESAHICAYGDRRNPTLPRSEAYRQRKPFDRND